MHGQSYLITDVKARLTI